MQAFALRVAFSVYLFLICKQTETQINTVVQLSNLLIAGVCVALGFSCVHLFEEHHMILCFVYFWLRGGWEGSLSLSCFLVAEHMRRASFISGSPAQKGQAAFATPSPWSSLHGTFCAGFAVGCAFTICAIFVYLLQLDLD